MATKSSRAAHKHETGAAHEEFEDDVEEQESSESDDTGLGDDLQKHLGELEDLIRESPLAAVGVAAGVGLLLGLLLHRR